MGCKNVERSQDEMTRMIEIKVRRRTIRSTVFKNSIVLYSDEKPNPET
jgi:hypothetical protein